MAATGRLTPVWRKVRKQVLAAAKSRMKSA